MMDRHTICRYFIFIHPYFWVILISCYSTTLILTVVVIALQLVPKPFVTPGTLDGPLLVLISNMTAHVYRNLLHAKYCGHREFLQWEDADWHPRVIGRYVNETNSNCYRNQAKTDTSSDLQF